MSTSASQAQKYKRLVALSHMMAAPAIPTVEDLLGMTGQGGALDDLITLVANDGDCRPILDAYSSNGETLSDLYWFLMRAGAGQVIGEKYVPCFALADPLVLEYLLTNHKADRLGPDTAANVVAFYQTGNKALLPPHNRRGATAAPSYNDCADRMGIKIPRTPSCHPARTAPREQVVPSTNLTRFMASAATKPYRDLVQHHVKRQSAEHLRNSGVGEVRVLSQYDIGTDPRAFTVSFIDYLNQAMFDQNEPSPLWSMNCRDAFDYIMALAASHAGGKLADILEALRLESKITQDQFIAHEVAFSVFQIATVTFAHNAALSAEVSAFIGIKNRRAFYRRPRMWVLTVVLALIFFGTLEHPVDIRSVAHALGVVLLLGSVGTAWTRKWQEFGPGWFKLAARVAVGIACGYLLLRV